MDAEAKVAKPIPLPPGVSLVALHADGRRFPVQLFPWPDPFDATRTCKVMVAGIYGETSPAVPIRIVCAPNVSAQQANDLFEKLVKCGWHDCYIEAELTHA